MPRRRVKAAGAAGAGVAAGTDAALPNSPLATVRDAGFGDAAAAWHAATAAGARSLGATGGALEVGRPADFFTVSLSDLTLAGVEPRSLPGVLLAALDRRMVREITDPLAGSFNVPGFPIKFSDAAPEPELVTPNLGQHNDDVLRDLAADRSGWAARAAAGEAFARRYHDGRYSAAVLAEWMGVELNRS